MLVETIRPVQEAFDEIEQGVMMSSAKWVWRVSIRFWMDDVTEWSDWTADFEFPNHFRTWENARDRMNARMKRETKKIELGILEFRLDPKYIGYIPGEESWLC